VGDKVEYIAHRVTTLPFAPSNLNMLSPLPAAKWNYTTAAHLLNRAGFGGAPAEIEALEKMGPEKAVAHLVDYEAAPDDTPSPSWAKPDPDRIKKFQEARELRRKMQGATAEERQTLEQKARELLRDDMRDARMHIVELRGWWLDRMAKGPRPLQEKLTLFWHGHFATSAQKVKDAYLMWQQNETFRRLATGSWKEMLAAVTQDPAMLLWLDQTQSRKEHPNENYAREVMELFTLGEGHYTEKDITEAARAFTGLVYDRIRQVSDYRPFVHDPGLKTFLGKTGRLTWQDVLDQIVAQPQAALFITAKLWRFFASENPSEDLVAALAETFRTADFHFKPVLRAMFRSEEFYTASVIRNQVKSPVQWLVGSARMLERDLPPVPVCSNFLANLGQDLFAPPNVKGWDGGLSWITTNNLLARYNQAEMLVYGKNQLQLNTERKGAKFMETRFNRLHTSAKPIEVAKILSPEERASKSALLPALEKRLLQGKLKPKQEATLRDYLDHRGTLDEHDILETIRLLMSTPEYQLT